LIVNELERASEVRDYLQELADERLKLIGTISGVRDYLQGVADDRWRMIGSLRETIAQKDARIAALEAAIEAAPHWEECRRMAHTDPENCDCWKSRALAAPAKEPA
jgi:hypothetical protein